VQPTEEIGAAMTMEDKVVVVAGGSAGIGKAAAQRFAEEGAHVVILARHRERLEQAAAEIGDHAVAVVADVCDPDSVRAAFAQVDTRFGRIDVLLNVAGVARARRIEDASDDDIRTVVGTNFLGPIYCTRAAVPLLRKAGGDIVNVSSEVTLDDMPMMTLYSASKRALNGFTSSMTKELRRDGIRVTLVIMGNVAGTAFGDNFTPEDYGRAYPVWEADGYLRRVSGTHAMPPSWIADVLLFTVTRPRGMMLDVVHARVFD